MPLLSFPSSRHRASLIAALLLAEFVVILWIRYPAISDRDDGSWKTVEFKNRRASWQHPELEDFSLEHIGRRGESDAGAIVVGEQMSADRSSDSIDKWRRWPLWRASISRKQAPQAKDGVLHRVNNGQESDANPKRHDEQNDTMTPQLSSSQANTPFSSLEGLVLTNSDSQVQKEAVEVKVSRLSEQVIEDKAKDRLDRKARSRHLHDEAARRAKMREERKQGQLIPVMDENGVEIEDHFISPRDLDGDGIPDAYVLLRPTDNSKYMMDVGLFDEDTAAMAMMVPAPPKPSSTESAPSPPPTPEPTKKPPVVVIVPGSQPIAPSHETLPSTDPPSSPQLPDPALSSDNKPSSEIVTDAAGSAQPTGSS